MSLNSDCTTTAPRRDALHAESRTGPRGACPARSAYVSIIRDDRAPKLRQDGRPSARASSGIHSRPGVFITPGLTVYECPYTHSGVAGKAAAAGWTDSPGPPADAG